MAVAGSRTRVDFALFIKELLDERYPEAEKVVLVMDQLNTHSAASLYEAFARAEARCLAEKLEIHHTPKHGSWLDMAGIELSVLGRQCLSGRIARRETLQGHVQAWMTGRNTAAVKADWQFTTDDARIKLRRLYPSIEG